MWYADDFTDFIARTSDELTERLLTALKAFIEEITSGLQTISNSRFLRHNRGDSPAHCQVRSMRTRCLLCFPREGQSNGIRGIPKSRFRQGVRKTPFSLILRHSSSQAFQPLSGSLDIAKAEGMSGRFETQCHIRIRRPQHRGETLGILHRHNCILLAG